MSKEIIFIILKIVSFVFIIWCIYNYNKFIKGWSRLKKKEVRLGIDGGDRYIEEINKLTNYKGG